MKATRILIIEPMPLVAEIMQTALSAEPEFCTVERAADPNDVAAYLDSTDVVLLNAALPNGTAMLWLQKVADNGGHPKIIVYGLTESSETILAYIEAGAAGYILRDDPFDKMIKTIKFVTRDKALASPNVVAALMQRLSELKGFFNQVGVEMGNEPLTTREREILELIGKGFSNKGIADALYIEYGTVKNHVHNILNKLNVSNRKEAAMCLAFLPEQNVA